VAAFLAEGERLFGPHGRDWAFRCPACGAAQTPAQFVALGLTEDQALSRVYGSCLGRLRGATQGCDWTLGGLFQIHTLEVGDAAPATPDNAPQTGWRGLGKRVVPPSPPGDSHV
jgi:hypothetical protein